MSDRHIQFCDGVRHLYLSGLNSISRCDAPGFRHWLCTSDNFVPVASANNDILEISLYDPQEVLATIASDINRLSCASLETIYNISTSIKNKKFLAWNLVNYYYSAFFSIHSLLKILGFGLVQIDEQITKHIKDKCKMHGLPDFSINSGMYCIKFTPPYNSLILYRVRRYSDNHKGLWQRFSDVLSILSGICIETGQYDSSCIQIRNPMQPYPQSIYSILPKSDAEIVITRIDEIRKTLNTNGDCNWLSNMRNLINYSQAFGVWFPYKTYDDKYENVIDMANNCFSDPLSSTYSTTDDKQVLIFTKYCQLLNSMNFNILNDLKTRHESNKSFLKYGFYTLKNQRK